MAVPHGARAGAATGTRLWSSCRGAGVSLALSDLASARPGRLRRVAGAIAAGSREVTARLDDDTARRVAVVIAHTAAACGYVRGRCLLRFAPDEVPDEVFPPGGRSAVADPVNRWVPLGLLAVGVLACAMAALDTGGGLRLAATATFLLLGPGWAIAGFLRRSGRALRWILALATGISVSILVGQGMALLGLWAPVVALYAVTGLCAPLLVRHAVVAAR